MDIKNKLQCYPVEDMQDPAYLKAKKLTPTQDSGRFCVVMTAPETHFNEGSRGSEKPTMPIPSPATLCGAANAVWWHPDTRFEILEFLVMHQISGYNIVKNEIESVPTIGYVDKLRKREAAGEAQDCSVGTGAARQQRTMGFLRDVKYIVTLQLQRHKDFKGLRDAHKACQQFKRHLVQGARLTPYLGIKECTADVRLCTIEDLMEVSPYEGMRIDFGRRPFQCDYRGEEKRWYQYNPIMIDGRIAVPSEKEVMGDAAYTA